ncbi:helix-turn-helix domain-containing protein [Nonomuraea deserti]|uniref:Helix-turn-helix domain-containing protein n=1 Tax=Nonomuraea deserti TaxID=1848322 RepID=A0A4R4UVB9_9ACTN|nr:helix-turn-helix domain-containing protein [Nonomuraea deserti]
MAVLEVRRYRLVRLRRETAWGRSEGEDAIQLILPVRGTVSATWAGRQDTVTAGDLYAHDLARLDEMVLRPDGRGGLEVAVVIIPKPVLPLRAPAMDAVLGHGVSADGGVYELLKRFVEALSDEKLSLSPADGQRLGMVLVDLVSVCFSNMLGSGAGGRASCRRQDLAGRIRAYIQGHLHDHQLTPRSIAGAHHISVSYLHRLFQDEGDTVSGFIRDQRLRCARRDLADAALADVPIRQIAARWGFGAPADFSRTFRMVYGESPREFRYRTARTPRE